MFLKRGHLDIREKKSWNSVFVVPRHRSLLIYENKEDGKPYRTIQLAEAIIESDPQTPTYRKYCFAITPLLSESDSETFLLFSAKSEMMKDQWLDVLQRHQRGEVPEEVSMDIMPHPRSSPISRKPMSPTRSSMPETGITSRDASDVEFEMDDGKSEVSDTDSMQGSSNPSVELRPRKRFSIRRPTQLSKTSMSQSDPVLPSLDSTQLESILSSLDRFKINEEDDAHKRWSLKRFYTVRLKKRTTPVIARKKDSFELMDTIITKLEGDPSDLAIFIDLPRIARNINILDRHLKPIEEPDLSIQEILKQAQNSNRDIKMEIYMRSVLRLMAIHLNEPDSREAIENHFLENICTEPARWGT
eukprot:TRINITY_DN8359_c0_g1_i1.p1 TRINITY_DN8359_c0_g1~~TRINITY_DN8359_c0_g1_i1.p1  ORF type:complete len:359 (-),score=88.80 TRINITY_DN8359_c0_g1_i1:87-1163(-)